MMQTVSNNNAGYFFFQFEFDVKKYKMATDKKRHNKEKHLPLSYFLKEYYNVTKIKLMNGIIIAKYNL